MSVNQLVVITGPSGVGKGTLVKLLLERHSELHLSVSATTRQPRPGEKEGKDYYFVSKEQFKTMIETDQLLEWAEYDRNYYGTPRTEVEKQLGRGKTVILEIEVVGAKTIQTTFPEALRIFILPPSLPELEARLRGRGNVPEASVQKRLEQAKVEIAASGEFDQQIVNDELETALKNIEAVIFDPSTDES